MVIFPPNLSEGPDEIEHHEVQHHHQMQSPRQSVVHLLWGWPREETWIGMGRCSSRFGWDSEGRPFGKCLTMCNGSLFTEFKMMTTELAVVGVTTRVISTVYVEVWSLVALDGRYKSEIYRDELSKGVNHRFKFLIDVKISVKNMISLPFTDAGAHYTHMPPRYIYN